MVIIEFIESNSIKDRVGGANVILKEDKTPPVIEQSFKTATKLKH